MSLISTYQSRKSLFAEKLITKGVEASATDGLTTLINKIGDISTCNNGLLFAVDKTIAQSGGTVNLSAMILKDGIFQVGETVNFYTGDVRTLGETHGPIDLGGNAWKLSIETLDTMVQFGADQVVITKTNDGYNITDAYQQHTYDLVGDYVCFDGTNLVLYNNVDSCDISDFDDIDTWESNIINDISYYPYPPATVHIEVPLTAVTGSNGVASVQYSCSGSGLKNFYATSGSLVSEIYDVTDCQYIDYGTSDNHQTWRNESASTFRRNNTGTTITASSSLFPRIENTITGDFEALFNASMTNTIRIALYDKNNGSNQIMWVANQSDEVLFRVRRVGTEITVQHSTDNGATWSDNYTKLSGTITDEDVHFGFVISTTTERSITFHDLRVYPI